MNKSFVLFTDYKQKFSRLTDEQLGKLLRIIFEYEETGTVPEIEDPVIGLSFDVISCDLAKQYEKYQAKVNAGKASGEKRKPTASNTNEQKGTERNKNEQNEQTDGLFDPVQSVQICSDKNKNKNNTKNIKDLEKESLKEKDPELPNVVEMPPRQLLREMRPLNAPELIDVQEFCALKNLRHVNPETFFRRYEAMNWRIGGQEIHDWRQLVMSWETDAKNRAASRSPVQSKTGSKVMDVLMEMKENGEF